MKVNFPQTVEELIHWDIFIERDSYGQYTIITGFEGTGGCFWCGKELDGRRRFCGHRSGCWTRYQDHFYWGFARYECLSRYDWHCANCGSAYQPEAHHIIPLEGMERSYSPYNVPWNLICLCHGCHQEIHRAMRPPKMDYKPLDSWNEAIKAGQGVLELKV